MFRCRWILLGVLLYALGWPAWGQSAAPLQNDTGGHALAFNGSNTTIRLPRSRFDGLLDTTIEGWLRFDRFTSYSRFFDVGSVFNSVNITHFHTSPNLMA